MGHRLITEMYEHEGQVELVYGCDTWQEAVRIHGIATGLGYQCYPSQAALVRHESKFIRIITFDDKDRVLLKLAL